MRPDAHRGVTLVELAVSIALVGIVVIPTVMVGSELLRITMYGRESIVALNLARSELERLNAINDFFAPDLAVGTQQMTDYLGFGYTVTRTITCQIDNCSDSDQSSQGAKRLTVVVSAAPGQPPLAVLTTLRTKHVTFGS